MSTFAYTYDADHHCESCALARFGRDEAGWITGEDSEGNEVGSIAGWETTPGYDDHDFDDGPFVFACGTCGHIIESQDHAEAAPYRNPFRSAAQLREDWWQHRYETVRDEMEDHANDLREAREEIAALLDGLEDVRRSVRSLDEILRDY